MAEEFYQIPEDPEYKAETIRKIQDSDPVRASTIINPVLLQLIVNTHAVKRQLDLLAESVSEETFTKKLTELLKDHDIDLTAHSNQRHIIATRSRDPAKPAYGLGGGGDDGGESVALETGPYTGGAEVSAIVNGVEYDAENMSAHGDTAPDGTLIITKLEE